MSTAKKKDSRFRFKLTVSGPDRFKVLYDGVLAAKTKAEATDFLSAFRKLLLNGSTLPEPEPGEDEVAIRKNGSNFNG